MPAFATMCLALFFGAHAPNLFVVAPPYLRSTGLDEQQVGIVMGSFAFASVVAMPFISTVSDRFGRRAPVMYGMLLVAAGCAAFEHVDTVPLYAFTRALQGAGWAAVLVGTAIYTMELAPPGRLAQALGISGVLTLAAMALGPTIGELIVTHARYVWLFRAAALAALGGAIVAARLPDTRPPTTANTVVAPIVPPPAAFAPLVATLLVATGFGAIQAFLADVTHRRDLGGVAPFFGAYVAAAILARLTLGHLSDLRGRHPVILPSIAGQALALAGIAAMNGRWQLVPLGALFGFTHGMYYPALQALIVERVPQAARTQAVAASNFAFSAGIASSAFVNGAVAKRWSYGASYATCAALAVVSLAIVAVDARPRPGGRVASR